MKAPKFYLPSIFQVARRHFPSARPKYFIKFDLANSFYNLRIHETSQFVTNFKFGHKYFVFQHLPFSISLAPLICQIFAIYIAKMLRNLGATLAWSHIDDVIDGHHYKEFLAQIARHIHDEPKACGILLNYSNSALTPTTYKIKEQLIR